MKKLFIQNENGTLTPTNMKELLKDLLGDKFDWESGEFNDGSSNWIEIRKRNDDDTEQVAVNLEFDDTRSEIVRMHVYQTPVRRVVMDEKCKRLV